MPTRPGDTAAEQCADRGIIFDRSGATGAGEGGISIRFMDAGAGETGAAAEFQFTDGDRVLVRLGGVGCQRTTRKANDGSAERLAGC